MVCIVNMSGYGDCVIGIVVVWDVDVSIILGNVTISLDLERQLDTQV